MRQSSFSISFLAYKNKFQTAGTSFFLLLMYNYFLITSGLGHYRTIAKLGKFIASQPHKRLSRRPTGGRTKQGFTTQGTTFIARHCANDFFLHPPRSSYKKLFIGTSLGEKLQAMSSVKAIPEGLKWVECKRGVGGKNSPIRYIPEQDPVQDALAKDKKTTYFKLTLPNTGNELKVAVWASGTPEQFLLHVRSAIHACKQMGLGTEFAAAERAVESVKIEVELAKEEYAKLRNAEKKKNVVE